MKVLYLWLGLTPFPYSLAWQVLSGYKVFVLVTEISPGGERPKIGVEKLRKVDKTLIKMYMLKAIQILS